MPGGLEQAALRARRAVSVPDIEAACQRFEDLGVTFQKRLTDGRMKNLAFIKDPDGYWVEIIANV